MKPLLTSLLALGICWLPSQAQAQDFDDEEEDDDWDWEDPAPPDEVGGEEANEKPVEDGSSGPDTSGPDTAAPQEEPDDFEVPMFEEEEDPDFSFDDEEEEETSVEQGPGEDTPAIYRAKIEEMAGWPADEEAMEWERYLTQYPNSLYQSRVEKRIDELSAAMFDSHMGGDRFVDTGPKVDAGAQELFFAVPVHLESIDPRDKLRFGFHMGAPDHLALIADYELQLQRELSVHAGIHGRYAGTTFEAGAKYALVKSTRTNTLITAMGDLFLNVDPAFPGFRPQLAVGKRLDIVDGLDIQLQAGSELHFRSEAMVANLVGGINGTLHANEQIAVYVESSSYMKDMFTDELPGGFRFNVVAFGLRFTAMKGKDDGTGFGQASIGATAPYSVNYWGYHYGAVSGDFNYFL